MSKSQRDKGARAYDLTYLSLGAGVQSSAMLVCSNLGLHGVPRADVAIFADTQHEPPWVYETMELLREWSEIPIEVVSAGNLLQDAIDVQSGKKKRAANIPLFTVGSDGKAAPVIRQCTTEYKVNPIQKRVRGILGYSKGQPVVHSVRCMVGISLDEAHRMKPNKERWITNVWPLIDARLYRNHCKNIVMEHLGFEPQRSACLFCPYRNDREWLRLKQERPELFSKACAADEALRSMPGLRSKAYVHRSLKPLREADFNEDQMDLFGNECEGMCGV